jgi:hypothetical protein
VNAAFTAFIGHPLEMFDYVGHIDIPSVDPHLGESLVQQLSRGADERAAGQILTIARLFADEHYASVW